MKKQFLSFTLLLALKLLMEIEKVYALYPIRQANRYKA